MPDPKLRKALFCCLFAYSNGEPVEIFDDVDGEYASANSGIALKVAIVGHTSEDFDDYDEFELMERLASAYDLFVDDPAAGQEHLQWVKPEVMRRSKR